MEALTATVGRYQIRAMVTTPRADRTPAVLVHGLGVSGRYWRPLARRLAPHRQVLVPDLPGHGRSPAGAPQLGVAAMAGVLEQWMGAVGISSAALVGNSLGCQIAAELAARWPARVAALVLCGPTVDPAARRAGIQLLRLARSAPVEHPALYPVVLADYLRAGPRRVLGELRLMLDHRIEEVLPRVRAPGLVIRGGFDRVVPRRWAAEVAALLPRGRLVEVPLAGHAAHFSRPGRVAAVVEDFLASLPQPSA